MKNECAICSAPYSSRNKALDLPAEFTNTSYDESLFRNIRSYKWVPPSDRDRWEIRRFQGNIAAFFNVRSERRSVTRHCIDNQPARDRLRPREVTSLISQPSFCLCRRQLPCHYLDNFAVTCDKSFESRARVRRAVTQSLWRTRVHPASAGFQSWHMTLCCATRCYALPCSFAAGGDWVAALTRESQKHHHQSSSHWMVGR